MKPVVVLIFAKWCSHCQDFKPTWNAFKNINNDEIVIMKEIEDIDINTELPKLNKELFNGSQEQIDGGRGFPTLVKVENGKISYYENERTPEMIAKWIGHGIKTPIIPMKGGRKRSCNKIKKTGKRYSRKCGIKNRRTRKYLFSNV